MYDKAASGVRKLNSVACKISPIKIDYSIYQKNSLFLRFFFFNKILLLNR